MNKLDVARSIFHGLDAFDVTLEELAADRQPSASRCSSSGAKARCHCKCFIGLQHGPSRYKDHLTPLQHKLGEPHDYVVVPYWKRVDSFITTTDTNIVRQIVEMPASAGCTAEPQLNGREDNLGGIELL